MPRKERLLVTELPQLLALRGNNGELLFRDEDDYRTFVGLLRQAAIDMPLRLHAFSLLPSQIYLLLTVTDKTVLARFIQYLGRQYVAYFNRRHGRSGVLWEGRYRNAGVEPASYFLLCQKYIELRALEAGDDVDPSLLSSGPAHLGQCRQDFLTPHATYQNLAAEDAGRQQRYRQFLSAALGATLVHRVESCLRQNVVLGNLNYCLELEQRLRVPVRPRPSGRPRKHYPDRLDYWNRLDAEARQVLLSEGYREIRLPLLDGDDEADDWAARLLSDGTMGCLRAIAAQHLTEMPARLWYQGPVFRNHHLDGGQLEQWHQIGAEALGFDDVDIELEQLLLEYALLQRLKLLPQVELEINTLGTPAELARYRQRLCQHFETVLAPLDPVARASLASAPEVLLGDRLPGVPRALIDSAPDMLHSLSDASLARFERLTAALARAGLPHTVRPDLFPHRPYYQHSFHEWSAPGLEDHPVLCRGGRYDEVATRVIGKATPACGFAFMVEPLLQLAEKARSQPVVSSARQDIAILQESEGDAAAGLLVASGLRDAFPLLAVVCDFGVGQRAWRLRHALKGGARIVLTVADQGRRIELWDVAAAHRQTCTREGLVSAIRLMLS
ncbi:MAG: ATP phosphoribosyltransferase regulatory subunit [Paludibacterium sp.]|uniref:ATP phosphoribosyltransferase regulatory subunit n=1 Tax=Paludibacterium sp. TaxID=1917523 RepID=UPI0025CC1B63|nr:ATP phosphoribosyltransferase regulatory subunit [Paludibacterium sp.]MBV8046743.1 ATP phosphoribosyltransferase regulatory subunit [Paludibacterium sp.]MBV8648291.1 ATP phosphoribosyltransferase regulatory subunit [Paludibacterium sp.]